jgi:hypothetical protein
LHGGAISSATNLDLVLCLSVMVGDPHQRKVWKFSIKLKKENAFRHLIMNGPDITW